MGDKVDMSLDDIIKMNKKNKSLPQRRNGLGRTRPTNNNNSNNNQRQSNVVRNNQFRNQRRSNPYSRPAQVRTGDKWKHDLFDGNNKPARLLVANLHFRVSDNDIKELFKEFGVIKKAAVHYDKSGRSLGNAEVTFANKISAMKACEKYNDVLLDGRKMKITLVTDKPIQQQATAQRRPLIGSRLNQNGNRSNRPNTIRKPGVGGNRSGGLGGGKPANKRQQAPTKEQLDAELDAYVNKN